MKLERAEDWSKATCMAGERDGVMTGEVAAGWTAPEMRVGAMAGEVAAGWTAAEMLGVGALRPTYSTTKACVKGSN
jgi:hypothetical protein